MHSQSASSSGKYLAFNLPEKLWHIVDIIYQIYLFLNMFQSLSVAASQGLDFFYSVNECLHLANITPTKVFEVF